jgi:hypothetical protein
MKVSDLLLQEAIDLVEGNSACIENIESSLASCGCSCGYGCSGTVGMD